MLGAVAEDGEAAAVKLADAEADQSGHLLDGNTVGREVEDGRPEPVGRVVSGASAEPPLQDTRRILLRSASTRA